jgi:hypothetical protein
MKVAFWGDFKYLEYDLDIGKFFQKFESQNFSQKRRYM